MAKPKHKRIYSVVLLINVTDDKQTGITSHAFEGEEGENYYIKIPASMIHDKSRLIEAINSGLEEKEYTVLLPKERVDDCVRKMRKGYPSETFFLGQKFFALLKITTKNEFTREKLKPERLAEHYHGMDQKSIRCHTLPFSAIKVDISRADCQLILPNSVISWAKNSLYYLGGKDCFIVDEKEEFGDESFIKSLKVQYGLKIEPTMAFYYLLGDTINKFFMKISLLEIFDHSKFISAEENWLCEDLQKSKLERQLLEGKLQEYKAEKQSLEGELQKSEAENEKLRNEVNHLASMFKKVELFSTMLVGAGVLYYSALDDSSTVLEAASKGLIAASLYYNAVTNAEKIIAGTEFLYKVACSLVASSFVERIAAEGNGYQQGR